MSNSSSSFGGAISTSTASLSIVDTIITANQASNGGGIRSSSGSLNIRNSTIGQNIASITGGGIVTFNSAANIANSSIIGNSSNRSGGGIFGTDVSFSHVTVTGNLADADGNGDGEGGGIFHASGFFVVKNSIIAENIDPSGTAPDCSGTFTSDGGNIIGANIGCAGSFPGGAPNINGDFVGTAGIPFEPGLEPVTAAGLRPPRPSPR